MPHVTVVIPAFNPGPFLKIALDSVVGQTFTDWEAIVVDDGSTEDLSFVAEIDPRIRLVTQKNQGLSGARNTALAQAGSEFIAFLDADDVWLPTKLDRQIETLTSSRAALCSTDFERINADGDVFGGGFVGCRASFLELLTGNGICVSTVMVRRAVLDEVGVFSERYVQAQDWHLWIRIAREHALIHVDEVLVQYRIHTTQMSSDYTRYFRESNQILDENASGDPGVSEAIRKGRDLVKRVTGAQAFDAFRASKDPRHLFHAIRLSPRLTLRQLKLFVARH